MSTRDPGLLVAEPEIEELETLFSDDFDMQDFDLDDLIVVEYVTDSKDAFIASRCPAKTSNASCSDNVTP